MFGKQKKKKSETITNSPFINTGTSSSSTKEDIMKIHTMQDDLAGVQLEDTPVVLNGKNTTLEKEHSPVTGRVVFEKEPQSSVEKDDRKTPQSIPSPFGEQSPQKGGSRQDQKGAPPAGLPVRLKNPLPANRGGSQMYKNIQQKGNISMQRSKKETTDTRSPFMQLDRMNMRENAETSTQKTSPSSPKQKTMASAQGGKVQVTMNPDQKSRSAEVNQSGGKRVFVAFLLIIIIGALLGGGYYYWQKRSQITSENLLVSGTPNEQSQQQAEPEVFSYEFERPNPIIIGSENSVSALQELSVIIEDWVEYDDKDGVLEFFFVDGAGEFEAISAEALMKELGVQIDGEEFTMQLGEAGRIFLHKKGEDIRIILSLEVRDRDAALALMQREGMDLVTSFQPVFMQKAPNTSTQEAFGESVHRDKYTIRYFNIDEQEKYSVDYTFRRNTLFIGMSKESLRATLDKLDGIDNI